MYQSITTRKYALKKPFEMKAPKVNDDVLQPGGELSQQLKHDKEHWLKKVTGSGVDCKLCR